jgi:ABC-type multidrug transport system fused ATPase/permease subunit
MKVRAKMQTADKTGAAETERHEPVLSPAAVSGATGLPRNVFRYVIRTSALHQLFLLVLTVAVFLLEVVPLELQRRIVNDLVKHRDYRLVIILCAVYAGVVVVQGTTKLVLNVYRGWVGERATRDLRRRIRAVVGQSSSELSALEAQGIEVSMIVAEVEPIGGFVGASISEPLLQGGVLLSVLAYMIHLDVWMTATAVALFVPQLVFVPLLQRAIIQRTGTRIQILRRLSISIVVPDHSEDKRSRVDNARIDHVFELDMGIFRLKFTMNFLMNLCSHLQIIAALLLGGWWVHTDQLAIGGVVAFISGIARLNDPWGDLVNYFRDVSVVQLKYTLVVNAVSQLSEGHALDVAEG